MPFAAAVAAVVGTATTVVGSVRAGKAEKRRVQAQSKIQGQQKKVSDIKAARERRRIARENRIQRAKISSATGGDTSSRAFGATASLQTQTASALGFAGQQQQGADNIFQLGGQASDASADLASAQSVIQIGSAVQQSASIFDK